MGTEEEEKDDDDDINYYKHKEEEKNYEPTQTDLKLKVLTSTTAVSKRLKVNFFVHDQTTIQTEIKRAPYQHRLPPAVPMKKMRQTVIQRAPFSLAQTCPHPTVHF